MQLNIIPYTELAQSGDLLKQALFTQGIVGISGIPAYIETSEHYINAVREFMALPAAVKQQYEPNRDSGDTEGYELGAEKFQNSQGEWQVDDKKASYYAYVPDSRKNKWPTEVDLQTPYLAQGELMLTVGRELLAAIGMDKKLNFDLNKLSARGRMLHYLKETNTHTDNPDWCGAHLDHGGLTALMPAHYFKDGESVDEPQEAGLYVIPTGRTTYEKIEAKDKSVLLFQMGEFFQLASNDEVMATMHKVTKTQDNIERFTLAVFMDPGYDTCVKSTSVLSQDSRCKDHLEPDGSIKYENWANASFDRYRVIED